MNFFSVIDESNVATFIHGLSVKRLSNSRKKVNVLSYFFVNIYKYWRRTYPKKSWREKKAIVLPFPMVSNQIQTMEKCW